MADPSHRVEITVAIIGVAGTLGAALRNPSTATSLFHSPNPQPAESL
jgi:hypothetical protein